MVLERIKEMHRMIRLLESASLDFYQGEISSPKEELRIRLIEFSRNYKVGLLRHFEDEESSLFPILREAGKADLVDRLMKEHEIVREMLKEFEGEADYGKKCEILRRIVGMLQHHLEEEDRLIDSL